MEQKVACSGDEAVWAIFDDDSPQEPQEEHVSESHNNYSNVEDQLTTLPTTTTKEETVTLDLHSIGQVLSRFMQDHVPDTCHDLEKLRLSEMSSDLSIILRYFANWFKADREAAESDIRVNQVAKKIKEVAWEKLHDRQSGGWNHVAWKESFIFAQLALAFTFLQGWESDKTDVQSLHSCISALDVALIMGAPAEIIQQVLAYAEPLLVALRSATSSCVYGRDYSVVEQLPQHAEAVPTIVYPIAREENPTKEAFSAKYYKQEQPVVITGVASSWAALQKWKDLGYLEKEFGHRTVPIEIGRPAADKDKEGSQSSSGWSEKLITISDFISEFLLPSNSNDHLVLETGRGQPLINGKIGYLAQHALIEQLPALQQDFTVPPYCSLGMLSNINTWLGTSATVTALHFDSYDNFLTQVAGYKYVRLYAKSQTRHLYREIHKQKENNELLQEKRGNRTEDENKMDDGDHHDHDHHDDEIAELPSSNSLAIEESAKAQNNFSQVVYIEDPDFNKYPLLKKAQYTEVILGPGDMLFIPSNCWHYVRSLTTSFSINFWF